MKIGASLPVREMQNDLVALKDFAQLAEGLGLTHLRVPEQILRPGSGHVHEAMMILAYIAGVTENIELVPSVIMLPARQTVLFAKQAAQLDVLTGGRSRIGLGVGNNPDEYQFLGQDFGTRGKRCNEQMQLLKLLWSQPEVNFEGEFDVLKGAGLNPLPVQQPIPLWIGARSIPSAPVIRRIGQLSDGWFVLASPEDYPALLAKINAAAAEVGRSPSDIGAEAGVAVVGPREAEWKDRVTHWHNTGLTHLCLRTLGGGLTNAEHLTTLERAVKELPVENDS